MTTRTEFLERLDKEFQRIREIFTERNKSYGKDEDLFHNFRQSAIRHFGNDSTESMFKVAEILVDKHNVALANKGANDPVCDERLSDRIVYSLIEKAMLLEKEKLKVRGAENIAGESRGTVRAISASAQRGTERE
jgi:hypothetical protein